MEKLLGDEVIQMFKCFVVMMLKCSGEVEERLDFVEGIESKCSLFLSTQTFPISFATFSFMPYI